MITDDPRYLIAVAAVDGYPPPQIPRQRRKKEKLGSEGKVRIKGKEGRRK